MSLQENEEKRGFNLLRKILSLFLVGSFAVLLFISLQPLSQGLFYTGENFSQSILPFDYSILAEKISSYLWTFRLFDLLLVLQIIFLIAICGYYLIKLNSSKLEYNNERTEEFE